MAATVSFPGLDGKSSSGLNFSALRHIVILRPPPHEIASLQPFGPRLLKFLSLLFVEIFPAFRFEVAGQPADANWMTFIQKLADTDCTVPESQFLLPRRYLASERLTKGVVINPIRTVVTHPWRRLLPQAMFV